MMFVPGNNPGMMQDAFIYGPDSIMLDLEDSVKMSEKDAARLLVYNALKSIDYGDTEMVVRINPLSSPYGKKDVEAVVKAGVDVIRMPKTETADEVRELEAEIEKVETRLGCLGRTQIMAAIESAEGICNAFEIAKASKRMMGIALGAEDYTANLKTQRTPEGTELLYARQTIIVAARAAGIDAFDTVYSNLDDSGGNEYLGSAAYKILHLGLFLCRLHLAMNLAKPAVGECLAESLVAVLKVFQVRLLALLD